MAETEEKLLPAGGGKMDVADKLQGCLFSHENGNMPVDQCMKRLFNGMGEVTLTPVSSAIECADANQLTG